MESNILSTKGEERTVGGMDGEAAMEGAPDKDGDGDGVTVEVADPLLALPHVIDVTSASH